MFINRASELMEESSSFETQSLLGNARPVWLYDLAFHEVCTPKCRACQSRLTAADEHRFTFTGSAGQRLFYDALDADFDAIYVYLYDPAGNNYAIAHNSDSDVGPFTLPLSGTYTLLIKGSGNYTGDYSFRLLDLAAAPAITYGLNVTNQINPQVQAQLYRIDRKSVV